MRWGVGRGGGREMNPFQGKLLYSILMALLLFFFCQFALLTRQMATLDDQRQQLQAEISSKERRLEEHQRAIWTKERDVHRLERRLTDLENRLRGRKDIMQKDVSNEKVIYFITPTQKLPTQKADLTRLSHTLMHVPNLFWILIEDAPEGTKSSSVTEVLKRSGLKYAHLAVPTPPDYKLNQSSDPNWLKPRGVSQRNTGLRYLRRNLGHTSADGVVYFGDDDNTYDLRLFEEMRGTEKVSVWPVGVVGGLMVERPLVDKESNTVTGWMVGWKPQRPFPIDMAGFAVNIRLILSHSEAQFSYSVPRGYQESHLLQKLVTLDQLEPKASLCTKVFVWHTRTEKAKLKSEVRLNAQGVHSDDGIEV